MATNTKNILEYTENSGEIHLHGDIWETVFFLQMYWEIVMFLSLPWNNFTNLKIDWTLGMARFVWDSGPIL